MAFNLLKWIFCPFCGGQFTRTRKADEDFGILSCYCGEYPVVAGIPVLKRGIIGTSNETAADVVGMIRAERCREALLSMIMPPPPPSPDLAPPWVQFLPSVKGIRRLKRIFHERAACRWRDEAMALLTQAENDATAFDLLDFYYHRSGYKWNEAYNYFAFRFGQPRHLVALSFTTLIDQPSKPVLDLACGYGHITRSLARRAQGQRVVGIDGTFIGLYLAKRFIAPEAEYLCSAADGALPFPDGFFSTVFCSDAFHYFVNKLASLRELRRLTDHAGLIILLWVHNLLIRRPHDGLPLPPEGYEALIADMPHRLVADSDVLLRYLQKNGPPLASSPGIARLSSEPMLSIVASYRQDVFQDYGCFQEWPHAHGRLQLNPLYRINDVSESDDVQLHRSFPSAFYVEDHSECKEYLPEKLSVRYDVLTDLADGRQTPEVEQLVGRMVALGMPERYRQPIWPLRGESRIRP